jgi:N4-gp56 family major capsid protein
MEVRMYTTYSDISPRTNALAVAKLLDAGQYVMVLERFGQIDRQPKNKTKVRKYRRYEPFARAVAPLAEGVVPAGQMISFTDVTMTLEEYGDYVQITDVIQDTHEDAILDWASKECGRQAAETIELIRFASLKGGTNVVYPGTATTRASVNGPLTRKEIRLVERAFWRNKAKFISTIVSATAKIATEPVAPAFFALCHSDLKDDIRSITGFLPVEKYANNEASLPNELGKVESTRFIMSSLFEPWLAVGTPGTSFLSNGGSSAGGAVACDVYPVIVVAQDAYAIVPLQGFDSVQLYVVNPKATTDQPLAQKGSVGWKTYQTAGILNQNWLTRIEVACSNTVA